MRRLLLAVLLTLVAAAPGTAASFTLDEAQRREAIAVGTASTGDDEFGREWQVTGPDGARVTVLTPFHRLALAA
ncbi:MAG TPA: hypothetical protein VNN07_01640, partial [Candidatus Tectomicrobia bacterium]|nr:hypothetical protein [Candidatus Tectomicrobia bacterium]